jgi:hypothetical protein
MNAQNSRLIQRDSAGDESDIALLRSVVQDENIFQEILELFGGTTVYIPKLDRQTRNKRIRSTYHELMTTKGMPSSKAITAIAHHEGVTTRCIYRLLSKRENDT